MPDSFEHGLIHTQAQKAKVSRLFAGFWRVLQSRRGGKVSAAGGYVRGALICLSLCASVQALCAATPAFVNVTLAWNPSPSGGVSGYRVYMGNRSGNYTNMTGVGNSTSITVSNLQPGVTYFFAITAFDVFGRESGFSNEINYTPPVVVTPQIASLQLRSAPAGGMTLGVTGPPGRPCAP